MFSKAITRLGSTLRLTSRNYETLAVRSLAPHVKAVELNRPDRLNAMNSVFWREMRECFNELNDDTESRVIILSGNGRVFTAGLDLTDSKALMEIIQKESDSSRKAKDMYKLIRSYQDSFSALEKCTKPVIAAVHNACVGGGINLISAADIRYCTQDAWFQIKEAAIGLAADVGVLQRMPKIVGSGSLVAELAYTARKMYSDEALQSGFVSRVFATKAEMMDASLGVAEQIAALSPLAIQGTKVNLVYSKDHTTDESLEYMARWNSTALQSEDVMKAIMAQMNKSKAEFEDY